MLEHRRAGREVKARRPTGQSRAPLSPKLPDLLEHLDVGGILD